MAKRAGPATGARDGVDHSWCRRARSVGSLANSQRCGRGAWWGMSQMGLPGGAGVGRLGALALPSCFGLRAGGRMAPARWERTSCSRASISPSRFFSCRSFAWARARAFFFASSAFTSFAFPRGPGVVFLVERPLLAAPCLRLLEFAAISCLGKPGRALVRANGGIRASDLSLAGSDRSKNEALG